MKPSLSSSEEINKGEQSPPSFTHILFPTALYFAVVFGMFPLQVQIVIQAICDNKNGDDAANESDDDCDSSAVSTRAAIVTAYCSAAYILPTFFFTGPYGALINRYGRKLGLCIPVLGQIVGTLCFLYIDMVQPTYFTSMAILGNFIMGVTGGYSTYNLSVFSYAADSTMEYPASRKKSYPIVEGAIFMPKLVMPIATGLWAHACGFSYPLAAGVVMGCVALIWLMAVVPESLSQHAEVRTVPLDLNPIGTLQNVAFIYQHKAKRGQSPLLYISLAFCLYYIAEMCFPRVFILYCVHMFNWGADTIGVYDGINGGLYALSMLFAPKIVKRLLGKELSLLNWLIIGYIARCLFFVGIGLSPTTVCLFVMLVFIAVAGPVTPYTRTILSTIVLPSEQAKIFAAFAAIESISTLFTPVMVIVYSISAHHGIPQLPFFIMSGCLVVSNVIVFFVRKTPSLYHNLPETKQFNIYSSFHSSFSGCSDNEETFDNEEHDKLLSSNH